MPPRVLLINPGYPISETPSPPLGLACLAGALEAADIETVLIDFVVVPMSRPYLEERLTAIDPDLVGVTAVTMTFDAAADIVRMVKQIAPSVKVAMGGPHVSFCAAESMRDHPEIDFIVSGEGEGAIVALARAVRRGTGWHAIPGVACRQEGAVVVNPPSTDALDLNRLPPPARHLVPLGRYRALGMPISMTTSRGCPFHCIFCVGRRMSGRRARFRNAGSVADEMAHLSAFGFHQINVADDLFTLNPDHCRSVCREIVRRGCSPSWTAFARVDTVDTRLLAEMRRAGCHTVSFGVESGDPEILKRVKKGIALEQVIDAVGACTDVGITPQVSFILGLPGETHRTVERTLAFGNRLKEMGALHGFHLLAPFPGTEIRERHRHYGIRILSNDWRRYHANRAVVETPGVSREALDAIVVAWEKKFDAYLGRIQRRMDAGTASTEEAWTVVRLEHTVVLYDLMMARAVERCGTWQNGTGPVPPKTALAELARRIGPVGRHDTERIGRSLSFAHDGGNLLVTDAGGWIRWRWKDYL